MGQAQVLSPLRVEGADLVWGDRRVPIAQVHGFHERWDGWTGRAWVEVRGPGWAVPIDDGYGAARRAIREHARRPFEADWDDGRYPSMPWGLPGDAVTVALVAIALAVGGAIAWSLGAVAGVAIVVAAWSPIARSRDAVVARRDGIRVGPAWAPLTPWADVREVCVRPAGRTVRVWIRGARTSGRATIPAALLPALRARVRRLGGLPLTPSAPSPDDRYAAWLAPASVIPWVVLVVTAVATVSLPTPWQALGAGLLVAAAIGLLGAAVEARATGWGAGAVLYASAVYAVVLAAIGLGLGGWLAP